MCAGAVTDTNHTNKSNFYKPCKHAFAIKVHYLMKLSQTSHNLNTCNMYNYIEATHALSHTIFSIYRQQATQVHVEYITTVY